MTRFRAHIGSFLLFSYSVLHNALLALLAAFGGIYADKLVHRQLRTDVLLP